MSAGGGGDFQNKKLTPLSPGGGGGCICPEGGSTHWVDMQGQGWSYFPSVVPTVPLRDDSMSPVGCHSDRVCNWLSEYSPNTLGFGLGEGDFGVHKVSPFSQRDQLFKLIQCSPFVTSYKLQGAARDLFYTGPP